jgi:small multidrug resistance pump
MLENPPPVVECFRGDTMLKLIWCLTKPLRVLAGLVFILLGSIPTFLIPGLGLFLGLPFLLIGGCLICS